MSVPKIGAQRGSTARLSRLEHLSIGSSPLSEHVVYPSSILGVAEREGVEVKCGQEAIARYICHTFGTSSCIDRECRMDRLSCIVRGRVHKQLLLPLLCILSHSSTSLGRHRCDGVYRIDSTVQDRMMMSRPYCRQNARIRARSRH